MKKLANVIEIIDENSAKIALYKHKNCTGCGFCNKNIHPGSLLTADNSVGAKKDNKVRVNISKKLNPLEIFVTYFLPTLMVFLGLWIGVLLVPFGAPDFLGLILALIFFMASLAVYFKTKHLFQPKLSAKIYKIIT